MFFSKFIKVSLISLIPCVSSYADKYIEIDLSRQVGYAIDDGDVIFSGKISSGKPGHRTPVGFFRISEKKRYHKSNLYPKPNGGASMPFMMRLSGSAVALHTGRIGRVPLSHGCIRLGRSFSSRLFAWAPTGTSVDVYGSADEFERKARKPKRYKKKHTKKSSPKSHRKSSQNVWNWIDNS